MLRVKMLSKLPTFEWELIRGHNSHFALHSMQSPYDDIHGRITPTTKVCML